MNVRVYVTPKRGVLDPQGVVIEKGLAGLGFGGATQERVGKVIEFRLEASSEAEAQELVHAMCRKFLTNPVIEDYRFSLEPSP